MADDINAALVPYNWIVWNKLAGVDVTDCMKMVKGAMDYTFTWIKVDIIDQIHSLTELGINGIIKICIAVQIDTIEIPLISLQIDGKWMYGIAFGVSQSSHFSNSNKSMYF